VIRRGLTVAVFLVIGLGLPACSSPGPSASRCLPEPLHVDPSSVVAGADVTVTSDGFKCSGSYPAGKTYHLTLGLVGRAAPIDLGPYPVNANGSFHATVKIPASTSPGEAYITVGGSSFDQCTDSGNGSCAAYMVQLQVLSPTA
jgi:hypothetical protein